MPRGVSATDSMQLAILTCQHADPQRRVQTKPYAEGPLKPQAQKCRRYQGSWGTLFCVQVAQKSGHCCQIFYDVVRRDRFSVWRNRF